MTIYQLTDLHLFAEAEARLKDVPTRETLAEILDLVRARIFADDVIVITGDLTHDEREESYRALRSLLGELVEQCWIVPGNHDDRALLRKVFADRVPDGERVNFATVLAGWRLIGLDSHIPREVPGRLGRKQLAWLAAELARGIEPVLVFLHHPPISVQSAWLDRIGLEDAKTLRQVIEASGRVQHIFAGHVHHDFTGRLGSVPVTTTPSTGVQFLPGAEDFAVDATPPGFRVIRVSDGTCTSDVIRAREVKFPPVG